MMHVWPLALGLFCAGFCGHASCLKSQAFVLLYFCNSICNRDIAAVQSVGQGSANLFRVLFLGGDQLTQLFLLIPVEEADNHSGGLVGCLDVVPHQLRLRLCFRLRRPELLLQPLLS